MSRKVFISRDFSFEASHRLPNYDGPCRNMHGHRYEGIVVVSGAVNETGMVMDYVDLKKVIQREILDPYDHRHLNDYWDNPTAEVMVSTIFDAVDFNLRKQFPKVKLERVELKETKNSNAWATS